MKIIAYPKLTKNKSTLNTPFDVAVFVSKI